MQTCHHVIILLLLHMSPVIETRQPRSGIRRIEFSPKYCSLHAIRDAIDYLPQVSRRYRSFRNLANPLHVDREPGFGIATVKPSTQQLFTCYMLSIRKIIPEVFEAHIFGKFLDLVLPVVAARRCHLGYGGRSEHDEARFLRSVHYDFLRISPR